MAPKTITVDGPWAGAASRPDGLLATAFAACPLKNVERVSQLMPLVYDCAEVDVFAHAVAYELRLVADVPSRRVESLHRNLRRYGTDDNTSAAACDLGGRIAAAARSGPLNGGHHGHVRH